MINFDWWAALQLGSTSQEVTAVLRIVLAPLSLGLLLLALTPTAGIEPGIVVGSVAVAAILLVAAVALSTARLVLPSTSPLSSGPVSDESHLHGSFRRLSRPDTPGRPRPRAPGSGFRPA